MNINPATLTWDQWKAAGRHALSYAAGAVTGAVFLGLFTSGQGTDLMNNINLLADGIGKVTTALIGIIGILTPIYTTWRAANSASPTNQAASTVKNIENNVQINGEKKNLIKAIADQPEVAQVKVHDPALAEEIKTPKVTT